MIIGQEGDRFPHGDQKCLALGIERRVPLFQGDVHRALEELTGFRTRGAYEYVELAKLGLDLAEHSRDFFHIADVGLDDESVRSALSDLLQRVLAAASFRK
jgi:hypothetical protein